MPCGSVLTIAISKCLDSFMATSCSQEVDSSDNDTPPNPKRKFTGSSTYTTKYDPLWKGKYPSLEAVKGDVYSFYCKCCLKKVSCKHQGIGDVKRHIQGLNHQKASKGMDTQLQLAFNSPKAVSIQKKVKKNNN